MEGVPESTYYLFVKIQDRITKSCIPSCNNSKIDFATFVFETVMQYIPG